MAPTVILTATNKGVTNVARSGTINNNNIANQILMPELRASRMLYEVEWLFIYTLLMELDARGMFRVFTNLF